MSERDTRVTSESHRVASGLRSRDPATLRALHRDYGRVVMGFLVRMLADHSAAEDVFQAVFLQVWQRGESYDPSRGTPLNWILTIARSRAIDQMRRRFPEPHDPASGSLVALESGEREADIDALVEEWRFAHLLSQLPEQEQTLLRRRFYDGRSQREIADETGITLGTVKTRMVQGLARLRDLIETEGQ